jgi:hypothetical protein
VTGEEGVEDMSWLMIRVYAWRVSDRTETEKRAYTFATASTEPVTVSTRSCTPAMTLLTPALTPVRSLSSATFLPARPMMTPASFVLTRARRVRALSWGGEGEREGGGEAAGVAGSAGMEERGGMAERRNARSNIRRRPKSVYLVQPTSSNPSLPSPLRSWPWMGEAEWQSVGTHAQIFGEDRGVFNTTTRHVLLRTPTSPAAQKPPSPPEPPVGVSSPQLPCARGTPMP